MTLHNPTGPFYSAWHATSSRRLVRLTEHRGSKVDAQTTPAEQPLTLYEYNGCPFCQRLRAVISELDLDAQVYPTPRVTVKEYAKTGDSRYRPEVGEKSGQLMFPYLEDPNTGTQLSDSGAIITYLLNTYGGGAEAKPFTTLALSKLLLRSLRLSLYFGVLRVPSRLPEQPLVFLGAQGDPGSIVVSDALTCLELPYLWKSCAKGSRKAGELEKLAGPKAICCLRDPNTGFLSSLPSEIAKYLYATYQIGNMANETIRDYSTKGASEQHGTISVRRG